MYKNNSGLIVYERHEIINQLIKSKGYKDYLEVGTDKGDTFTKIEIKNKECCDPVNNIRKEYDFKLTYQMTSDEMFEKMPKDKKYDIIFLDGMHDEKYLDRDIINALHHVKEGGLILCQDTIPTNILYTRKYSMENIIRGGWTGDVYKSILKLQEQNISFYTLMNVIHGMTIIEYNPNYYNLRVSNHLCENDYYYIFGTDDYTQEYNAHFSSQGLYAMHIIDYEQFKNIFNII